MIKATLRNKEVTTNSTKAYTLQKNNHFGEKIQDKVHYSLFEAMYLLETRKIEILEKDKLLTKEQIENKFSKIDKKFETKYLVYKNLRKKGHIPKTALKFGAEFLVYEKETNPKKAHSKWVVFTDTENNKTSWHDFAAKNRVAHSTKKKLLIAIVDDRKDVLFYEIGWKKIWF